MAISEQDFINIENRAYLRIVLEILRKVEPCEPVGEVQLLHIRKVLAAWEEALIEAVEVEG